MVYYHVTLATDDGQQIKAHKMILYAGSHVFSDIISQSNHLIMPIMFISLKGINRAKIDHVTELFIMEKNEWQWTCKVCGKESNKKKTFKTMLKYT